MGGKKATRFQLGNPGRRPGSKNNSLTRARIQELVDSHWNQFETELTSLKGRGFVELFTKLLPYVTPAYQSINFNLQSMSDEDLEHLARRIREVYGSE